jgi:uncharacterized protein YjbJ (UPF0337 family)
MAGKGKELKGGLKEGAGKLLGNEELEAKGRAEKTAGRTRRRAGGAAKEVVGTAKAGAGKLTRNKDLELEGKAQRETGLADER